MTRTGFTFMVLAGFILLNVQVPLQAQAPVRSSSSNIDDRLARIEQILQSRGLVDLLQQLEALQREVSQLRGQIEVQNRTIAELRRRQQAMYTDIDQRLQGAGTGSVTLLDNNPDSPPLQTLSPDFSNTGPVDAPGADAPLDIEVVDTLEPGPVPADRMTAALPEQPAAGAGTNAVAMAIEIDPVQVQAEYQQAFDLLKQSRYESAIQSFRGFLARYPVSDYSDNAQYWLGEAYYVMRQFEQALQEYNTLISRYPRSQKFTHAMLKIGYSYHELGLIDEAKQQLQALTRQHPGTTASRLAEERLKSIAIAEQQAGGPVN